MSYETEYGEYGADRGPYAITVSGIGHTGKLEGNIEGLGAAVVQWSGDMYENAELTQFVSPEVYSGDEYFGTPDDLEEGDYFGSQYEGDTQYGFLGINFKKGLKTVAHAVHTVAKPVAFVAAVGAAGTAVVFPPAAPVLAAVAAQAAVAATIASQVDSSIPNRKKKGQATLKATQKVVVDADKAAREANRQKAIALLEKAKATDGYAKAQAEMKAKSAARIEAAAKSKKEAAQRALDAVAKVRQVRNRATSKGQKMAFVITKRGFVIRVK